MAEESGGSSWWGTWGSEFVSSVREKSSEAMNMVKQDLAEFVCTIQHDTSAVVADTATAVKESLKVEEEEEQEGTSAYFKQGVSKFLGTLSNSLRENISHVATAAAAVTFDGPEPVFDRMQARLHEIQTDPATFCSEPDGHLAMYEEWCKTFDPEQHKGEISELLVNVPEIRALYAKLVPSAVTHVLFWQRYFYKEHQLKQEEKKRAAIVARANQAQVEDLGWGDEDLWGIEEIELDSQLTSKHAANEDSKESIPDKTHLTEPGEQESIKEVSGVATTETKAQVSQSTVTLQKQEKPVVTAATTSSDLSKSEEVSEGKGLELEDQTSTQDSISHEQAELQAQKSKQSSQHQTNNQEKNDDHLEPSLSELSKTVTEDTTSGKTADVELQATLHKRENSSGSVDSSWSKLSEEELKANGDKEACSKEIGAGSGNSSTSSSSGVLVPSVDDKDVEWDDDDDDLDFNEDMSEEEVKRIMQSMETKKQNNADDGAGDVDDDDWENWD
ncbi:uncharacterized protein LOC144645987 [Oculina patagonica]